MTRLAGDQLHFLVTAAHGLPETRCLHAENFGHTPGMQDLVAEDLVRLEPASGRTRCFTKITERGKVLLDAMRKLPLPEACPGWRMPEDV